MTNFTGSNELSNTFSTGPRLGSPSPSAGTIADPAAVIDMAAKAERSGFASLWVMDRVLLNHAPPTPHRWKTPVSSRRAVLGVRSVRRPQVAATATERIRLGTSVLVAPWYSPLLLARTLTAIDLASHTALSVGLGLGWSVDEYDAVCAPLDHRGGCLDEIIDGAKGDPADAVTTVSATTSCG